MAQVNRNIVEFIRKQRSLQEQSDLPLSGIRVVDMSTIVAAPSAAMHLGDAGAEVIKVENPAMPDGLRDWGVIKETGVQPWYAIVGRNKYPVTMNLKTDTGKRLFHELIMQTDVLIENMRPGAMDRLGLGTEDLLKRNPGLIIGKVSGYGQTGPYAMKPGFGTLAEAFSGFTYLNAHPGGPPTSPPAALADFVAGLNLAFAVLVCLRNQKRGQSGGQIIDISLYEPLFSFFGADFLSYFLTGDIPQPMGNELKDAAPRNNYRTKNGDWVALSCSSQKPWERLAEAMGRSDMIHDPRFASNETRTRPANRKAINDAIQTWIGTKETNEFFDICTRLGLTAGPIPDMKGIAQNPHYNQRGTLLEIEDPASGVTLKMPDVAYRMLSVPGKIRFPGLPQASANEVIFQDLLGYTPEEVQGFKNEGAI